MGDLAKGMKGRLAFAFFNVDDALDPGFGDQGIGMGGESVEPRGAQVLSHEVRLRCLRTHFPASLFTLFTLFRSSGPCRPPEKNPTGGAAA